MKLKIASLIIQAIVNIGGVAWACVAFHNHDTTNGLLVLIFLQLYGLSVSMRKP